MRAAVTTLSAPLVFVDGTTVHNDQVPEQVRPLAWDDLAAACTESTRECIRATPATWLPPDAVVMADSPGWSTDAWESPVVTTVATVAWRHGDHWIVDRQALARVVALALDDATGQSDSDLAWLRVHRAIDSRPADPVSVVEQVAHSLGVDLKRRSSSLLDTGRIRHSGGEGALEGEWLAEHGSGGTLHQLTSCETLAEAEHLVDRAIDAARSEMVAELERHGEPLSLLAQLVIAMPRRVHVWATAREIEAAGEERRQLAERDAGSQLLARDVAAMLGIKPESLRRQVRRQRFPAPDGRFGRVPWWGTNTVAVWRKEHPKQSEPQESSQSAQQSPAD